MRFYCVRTIENRITGSECQRIGIEITTLEKKEKKIGIRSSRTGGKRRKSLYNEGRRNNTNLTGRRITFNPSIDMAQYTLCVLVT